MDYIVKSFDPSMGSIVVEFAGEFIYSVDVPIENGAYITGEALHSYILGFAPSLIIDRKSQIANGIINEDDIKSLVAKHDVIDTPSQADAMEQEALRAVQFAVEEELKKAKLIALINSILDEREKGNV